MRRIGTVNDESHAQRITDFLVTQSMDVTMDHDESEGVWYIWVRDEQSVEVARATFQEFQENPDAPRFQVQKEASRIRQERLEEERKYQEQQRKVERSMPTERRTLDRPGSDLLAGLKLKQERIPVTITLIVISIFFSITSNFGRPPKNPGDGSLGLKTYQLLSFVDYREYLLSGNDAYASLKEGQWWRMVTPMFLHGDEFHLAFNMLWMFFLGSIIERLHGSLFLVLLTFGTQTAGMMLQVSLPSPDFLPELAEYLPEALQGSPFAIGASGAVYGLFGFLWIRPAVDPNYPVHLVPLNVILMIGWLFACMTPLVPNVANGAHLGGLLGGMLFALVGRAVTR